VACVAWAMSTMSMVTEHFPGHKKRHKYEQSASDYVVIHELSSEIVHDV
jgi:hypothetical protein